MSTAFIGIFGPDPGGQIRSGAVTFLTPQENRLRIPGEKLVLRER